MEYWLVDWDIPRERRFMFYYYLRKLKRRYNIIMSSASVLVTRERSIAEKVYRLATKYGKANLYRAEKIA